MNSKPLNSQVFPNKSYQKNIPYTEEEEEEQKSGIETDLTLSISSVPNAPPALFPSSPCWCAVTSSLIYVDIFGKEVIRLLGDKGSESMKFDEQVAFAIPASSTRRDQLILYVGLENRVLEVDFKSKTVTRVIMKLPNTDRIINGKCSPSGSLFICCVDATRTGRPGRLYRMKLINNEFHLTYVLRRFLVEEYFQIPNGSAWVADDDLFVIDSAFNTINRYKVFGLDGDDAYDFFSGGSLYVSKISSIKVISQVLASRNYHIEGLTMDADKMLWVTIAGAGCVLRVDPNTGQEIQRLFIPADNPCGCVFDETEFLNHSGGQDLETLFITTRENTEITRPNIWCSKIKGIVGYLPTIPVRVPKNLKEIEPNILMAIPNAIFSSSA